MVSISFLAYIDPGLGSLVLQVCLASLLAVGYTFRHAMLWPCRILSRRSIRKSFDQENL